MLTFMHKFLRAETGATAIEYGMIACFVVLAIIGSIQALGQGLVSTFYDKLASLF